MGKSDSDSKGGRAFLFALGSVVIPAIAWGAGLAQSNETILKVLTYGVAPVGAGLLSLQALRLFFKGDDGRKGATLGLAVLGLLACAASLYVIFMVESVGK